MRGLRYGLGGVAVIALVAVAVAQEDIGGLPAEFNFDGAFQSQWSRSAAQEIALDPTNQIPLVLEPETPISEEFWVWDAWPMRNEDNTIAVVDGWVVLMALTAPIEDNIPGERHGMARWRYFYTQGGEWIPGGLVFPPGEALGSRQWAGSAIYDDETGTVTMYYTALGDLPPGIPLDEPYQDLYEGGATRDPDEQELTNPTRQEIARTSARVIADDTGVRFTEFTPHEIILTADGTFYATVEQTTDSGALYVFRDPFWFRDPNTGEEYIVFSATAPYVDTSKRGVVGLAQRDPESETGWTVLPPLLGAFDVNSQLERPHFLFQEGIYYLFFTSHAFSFAEGITGVEGLYGFASDASSLRGHYVALNESGLVLGNPGFAPLQTYSFLVLPGGRVLSYINYVNLGDVTLGEIGDQSREFQREHFGGTLAPLLEIDIEGQQTRLVESLTDIGL